MDLTGARCEGGVRFQSSADPNGIATRVHTMLIMRTHTMLFGPAFHLVMPMKNFDLTQLSVLVVEKHRPMRPMLRGILRELGVRNISDASTTEAG